MKILIVEDEPALRELIQRSLEKERYLVEVAADFNTCIQFCQMERFRQIIVRPQFRLPT